MEQINAYLDELFAPLPHNPAMQRVRRNLRGNMLERCDQIVALGRSEQEAGAQVVAEFSEPGDSMTDTDQEALGAQYRAFHKKYPVYIAVGFGGMLVIPILVLFLFLNLESKIVALTAWIASVLVFIAFIICVTYRHEAFKKKLGICGGNAQPSKK